MLFLFSFLFWNAFSFDTANVVKIEVQALEYSSRNPWAAPRKISWAGSGFIVEGNRIITNAHVARNAAFIEIRRAGDSQRYTAKVKRVLHSVDLAIIEVNDADFFKDFIPLEIGDTPHVGDEVTCYGFPVGGEELSVTKGIVSRVEMLGNGHSGRTVFACDMDAASAPGNSGGPVIKDGKVVGVTYGGMMYANSFGGLSSKEGGYFVSSEVLKKVLFDDQNSKSYRMPDLGIVTQTLENKSMKKRLNIDSKNKNGILVTKIADFSPLKDILQEGDILIAIDNYEISNNATVEFRKGERTHYDYAYKRKSVGESIEIFYLRAGQQRKAKIELSKTENDILYANEEDDKERPIYYFKGGLVFQPFNRNLGRSYGEFTLFDSISLTYKGMQPRTKEQPNIIVVSSIQDELTAGYKFNTIEVEKINGIKISYMQDVVKAFEAKVDYHVIELKDGYVIMLDKKLLDERNEQIMQNYGIDKDSFGLNA